MKTEDIRQRFLRHFQRLDHLVVPSAPLPADDPTLLFVNAGMVPFKPYFLGQQTPPAPRATSVQKVLRTIDIDEVGRTSRHCSFFQMNGNFSFGDYFKAEAMRYAWDLVTRSQADGGYGLPESTLWVTIYTDDDESARLWQREVGLPPERIQRRGMADNFWSMGVPGPCGPCSEIYVDRGPEYGAEGGPVADEDRYMEIWNLVFMQYERGAGGGKDDFPILGELPAKNIDTGMGLERVASLLQGVDNVYEIDISYPVLARAAELTGRKYGEDHRNDVALRVVTDHLKAATMVIADGVTPSNEGKGYVLRRLLRRAIRNVRLLGYEQPSLPVLLPVVRDMLAPSYPELVTDWERITSYAFTEEESFLATLAKGTTIFDGAVAATRSAGAATLAGAKAFELHDTYGFPIDLTLEMAAEQGLSVDEEGFRRLMAEQRSRAKADATARKTGHADLSAYRAVLDQHGRTTFTGYTEVARDSVVRGVLGVGGALSGAAEGDDIEVVLDATPFYAEGGGQQPDTGLITLSGGEVEVYDVQAPVPGLVVHRARVLRGEVRPGDEAHARIDVARRRAISRAHTATHLIHTAMRGALGEHATQAGSLNAPGRLRFDFNTPGAVPDSVLGEVEDAVNTILLDDLEVRAYLTSLAEARRIGAMALFGEKYGDEVRVVEVGDYARELCGGTHVARSGQLGVVKILSEASIGAGVRRVEALVGLDAFRFLAREHVLVSQLAETFKAQPEEIPERVHGVIERLRVAEKELERMRAQVVLAGAGQLAAAATEVHGVAVVAARAPAGVGANDLRRLASDVRGRLPPSRPAVVVLLAAADGAGSDPGAGSGPGSGKVSFVAALNDAARQRGLSANDLVRVLGPAVGGRGGGKADLAQGAGTNAAGIADALALVRRAVSQQVAGQPGTGAA
ncbi:MAG TPA: alanine--tRNA ligase [Mycobacteriales bacterium]|nr:alanine--tRNA ligase [Mycobacteriales bacterium]